MLINTYVAVKVPGPDCRFDKNCTGSASSLVFACASIEKLVDVLSCDTFLK